MHMNYRSVSETYQFCAHRLVIAFESLSCFVGHHLIKHVLRVLVDVYGFVVFVLEFPLAQYQAQGSTRQSFIVSVPLASASDLLLATADMLAEVDNLCLPLPKCLL